MTYFEKEQLEHAIELLEAEIRFRRELPDTLVEQTNMGRVQAACRAIRRVFSSAGIPVPKPRDGSADDT
jgi:hypothetical protein